MVSMAVGELSCIWAEQPRMEIWIGVIGNSLLAKCAEVSDRMLHFGWTNSAGGNYSGMQSLALP